MEMIMSVAKVIELSAESNQSFEHAIREGVAMASKTVRNIKSAWVKEQQVTVEGDKITRYRVDLKVTFVLD
ncbi:MAG TPA: dodecin family protein [Burkholderiaceae bacterium]|nr:dodecin family protein [Burkholderiaceae bacterium]